jgi:hypothetical protein
LGDALAGLVVELTSLGAGGATFGAAAATFGAGLATFGAAAAGLVIFFAGFRTGSFALAKAAIGAGFGTSTGGTDSGAAISSSAGFGRSRGAPGSICRSGIKSPLWVICGHHPSWRGNGRECTGDLERGDSEGKDRVFLTKVIPQPGDKMTSVLAAPNS